MEKKEEKEKKLGTHHRFLAWFLSIICRISFIANLLYDYQQRRQTVKKLILFILVVCVNYFLEDVVCVVYRRCYHVEYV